MGAIFEDLFMTQKTDDLTWDVVLDNLEGGSRTELARKLGIGRSTLYHRGLRKDVVRLSGPELAYVLGVMPTDLRRAHVWYLLRQLGPMVGVLVPDDVNS